MKVSWLLEVSLALGQVWMELLPTLHHMQIRNPNETERDETDLSDGPIKTDQHTVPYWK